MTLQDFHHSAMKRELLAAYRAVQHFHYILEGQKFTLFTDHKPLVTMMAKAADSGSPMQARHLSAISEFITDVRHLEGKSNLIADALSGVEIDSATPSLGIDFGELAKAQQQDPNTRAARTAISGLRLQDVDIEGATLLCDLSQGRQRLWVQDPFRRTVFQAVHNLSHLSARATGRLMAERLCCLLFLESQFYLP